MKSRLTALFLALTLMLSSVVCFASCGKSEDNLPEITGSETTVEETTAEETTEAVIEITDPLEKQYMGDLVPSETYKGTVSKDSFDDKDSAAEAFVKNELSGSEDAAVLTEYKKVSDLTKNEIDELAQNTGISEEIVSAEKIVVYYTSESSVEKDSLKSQDSTVILLSETDDSEKKPVYAYEVYIIVVKENGVEVVRYVSPEVKNGEMLTMSYYESVLDPSKYINCTLDQISKLRISAFDVSNPEDSFNYGLTSNDHFESSETATLCIEKTTGEESLSSENSIYTEWIDDSNMYWVKSGNGSWQYCGTDFDVFAMLSLRQYDATYYEKTPTGFKLNEESYRKIIENQFAPLFGELIGDDVEINLDAYAYYYVSEGRLTQIANKISCSFTVVEGERKASCELEISCDLDVYNVGSTVVTRPEGVAIPSNED